MSNRDQRIDSLKQPATLLHSHIGRLPLIDDPLQLAMLGSQGPFTRSNTKHQIAVGQIAAEHGVVPRAHAFGGKTAAGLAQHLC